MKAVLFDEKVFVNLEGATKPQIKTSNGTVVAIRPMVICDSDLNILKSQIMIEINGIMGREGAGVIQKATTFLNDHLTMVGMMELGGGCCGRNGIRPDFRHQPICG